MTQDELYSIAEELGRSWAEPDLAADLTIEFNRRMSKTLGRCLPERRTIRLNASLQTSSREFIREVLCHELAHVVVHQRHGSEAGPHGSEWQGLVEDAGYRAHRRVPPVGEAAERPARLRSSELYEHRCPVCHSVRVARTAKPTWRCRECLSDGLDGELLISRIASSGADV